MIRRYFLGAGVWGGLLGGVLLCGGCGSRPVETIENLKNISADEGYAARRYAEFSAQAEEEGLHNIANLFEALACSERVHTEKNFEILEEYGDTLVGLRDSLLTRGRTLENLAVTVRVKDSMAKTLLPAFAEAAGRERAADAARLLEWMGTVAERHVIYCQRALVKLGRDGSDVNVINSWSVCPECGNLYYTTSLEENCALCLTPASLFFLFQ